MEAFLPTEAQMNLRLTALRFHVPHYLRREKLQTLLSVAATGFNKSAPSLTGQSFRESWLTFATTTRTWADELFASGQDPEPVWVRLKQATHHLGSILRKELRITNRKQALLALKILYASLGVKWHTTENGMVSVYRCKFSEIYTSKVCRFMSAMDEGLVEGITHQGKLFWNERITDGHPRCLGRIEFP